MNPLVQLLMQLLGQQAPAQQESPGGSGGRWDMMQKLLLGQVPSTGTYSTEDENMRFPSMVPGNTQWLTPAIKMGAHPRLSDEQFQRALEYALQSGNYKPASEPMSPFGSSLDFFNPSAAARDDARVFSLRDWLNSK